MKEVERYYYKNNEPYSWKPKSLDYITKLNLITYGKDIDLISIIDSEFIIRLIARGDVNWHQLTAFKEFINGV